ncbi:MAG: PspC domain-containing protein [Litorilinea sp.]
MSVEEQTSNLGSSGSSSGSKSDVGVGQSGASDVTSGVTGQAQPYLSSETGMGEPHTPSAATATSAPSMAAGAGEASSESTRRMLYRHPGDTVLGGVCGGLADYFGWDAALVRILWVVLTLATSGGGLLAYVALWILLPVGTIGAGQERPATLELNERNLGRAAWLLIGLGAIWLLGNVGILPWIWGGFWRVVSVVFWPLLLIGVGYVLLRYMGKTNNWRSGFGNRSEQVKSSVKSSVGERMPTRESVKSSFHQMRHKLPLKRSRTDRIWMGVCGGIGQRLGLDSNLVRLIWAAFSVGSIGMGVLLYIIAGLLLVEDAPAGQLSYADDTAHDVQIVDATSASSRSA